MYTFEMDFWSSREIRDKERPLNVDSTFKRLSRRLLHCRSLVKIHARSNCEGYPSMDNIHQQSWATTLCPFSLFGPCTYGILRLLLLPYFLGKPGHTANDLRVLSKYKPPKSDLGKPQTFDMTQLTFWTIFFDGFYSFMNSLQLQSSKVSGVS